ncbi:MAG: sigma-70 family RNA polymerase sigma factor [Bryobacteraceae bacterium]|nr:sigma-70 family RNA polymerase sigma factor [Bryobacteraceae bacterium]
MTEVARTEPAEANLTRAIQGDMSAFAEILREHQAMVFSLAFHCLGDRALAEEVAQDVFLQLHRNLAEIESAAHLKFWLRRVTANRAIDITRRRRWWPKFGLDDVAEPVLAPREADHLLSRKLRRLIAALPERQRVIVVLRYQEDMDPSEIAAVLDMPVATVKSYLYRALSVLRKELGGKTE